MLKTFDEADPSERDAGTARNGGGQSIFWRDRCVDLCCVFFSRNTKTFLGFSFKMKTCFCDLLLWCLLEKHTHTGFAVDEASSRFAVGPPVVTRSSATAAAASRSEVWGLGFLSGLASPTPPHSVGGVRLRISQRGGGRKRKKKTLRGRTESVLHISA